MVPKHWLLKVRNWSLSVCFFPHLFVLDKLFSTLHVRVLIPHTGSFYKPVSASKIKLLSLRKMEKRNKGRKEERWIIFSLPCWRIIIEEKWGATN